MRKIIIIVIFAICSGYCYSQSSISLTFSQTQNEDWSRGKYSSIEGAYSHQLKLAFNIGKLTISLQNRLSIGVRTEKSGTCEHSTVYPTDNDIYAEAVAKYNAGWFVDPYFSLSAQTQLTESFSVSGAIKTPTSNFRDPITTIESSGFSYKLLRASNFFTAKAGLALKQVRAHLFTSMTDDCSTPDIVESYKYEFGVSYGFDCSIMIDSSTRYSSSGDFFSSFDNMRKQSLAWRNEIRINIWKYFGITVKADLFYDDTQSHRIQYNQSVRLGLMHSF